MTEYELHVCGNCAAFGMHIDGTESKDDGACHRYPPGIVSLGGMEFSDTFPSVNREDWCLEWVERKSE